MTERDKQGLKDYCDSVRKDIMQGKDLAFHLNRLQDSIKGIDAWRKKVDPENKNPDDFEFARNEYYRLIWEIKEYSPSSIQKFTPKMSPEEEEIRRGENLEMHLAEFTQRVQELDRTIKTAEEFGLSSSARGFEKLKEEYYRLIYLIKEQL